MLTESGVSFGDPNTQTKPSATMDIGLFRYNTPPTFCSHALDYNEDYYRRAGVSRMHTHDRLDLDGIRPGDLVFIKTNALSAFCQVLPKLKVPIGLITGVSDICPLDYRFLIEDDRIVSWCGQFLPQWSEKILQYPSGFAERERDCGDQQAILDAVGGMPWRERPIDILMTPMSPTSPERRDIVVDGAHVLRDRLPYRDYLQLMARSKFVICPRGNAPDSIRLWEALAVGAVPITRTGILDPIYSSFGAIIVQEWEQAADAARSVPTGEPLRAYALQCFANRTGLFFSSYWQERTREHHARLLAARVS